MSLTYNDWFCGAGGSSIGLTAAGFELKVAANHWARAIETHSANFPDAEHLCADLQHIDLRRLPRTDVLWASPICTELSPAGGRGRGRGAQLDLLEQDGPVSSAGYERTRVTFWEVIRAAEIHRYSAIIVENVVEAADWELFDIWLAGMTRLGYNHQFVCVSSAHVGSETNRHAPQWRDRMYIVLTRTGIRLPDVRPRPAAWCPTCDEYVAAVQSWKRPDRRPIGKYGIQYVYRCPNSRCRHQQVEPFVLPAAAAIDWTDVGQRIGDRPRPLAAATMRRIAAGIRMFAQPTVVAHHGNTWERPGSDYVRAWPAGDAPLFARTGTPGDGLACPPFMVAVNHDDGGRHYPVDAAPLPARTVRIGDGLTCPPLLVPAGGTWNDDASPVDQPMRTRTTRDTEGVLCPPFVTVLRENSRPMGVDEPLATLTTGRNHGVTIPPGAFIQKHHGGLDYGPIEHMTKDVREPLPAVVAKPNLSLVIPYRRGAKPHRATAAPLSAVATREQHGLLELAIDVDDCHFRMLKPREHLRAQRFPDTYIVTGNKGEQTMQAGNAVSANVAQWLGEQLAEVLA